MKLKEIQTGMKVKIKPNWKQIMTEISKNNGAILIYTHGLDVTTHFTYDYKDVDLFDSLIGEPVVVGIVDVYEEDYLSVEICENWINHECLEKI